jgi:hypothetical protein
VKRRIQQIARKGETMDRTQRGQKLSPTTACEYQEKLATHSLASQQIGGRIADQIGLGQIKTHLVSHL